MSINDIYDTTIKLAQKAVQLDSAGEIYECQKAYADVIEGLSQLQNIEKDLIKRNKLNQEIIKYQARQKQITQYLAQLSINKLNFNLNNIISWKNFIYVQLDKIKVLEVEQHYRVGVDLATQLVDLLVKNIQNFDKPEDIIQFREFIQKTLEIGELCKFRQSDNNEEILEKIQYLSINQHSPIPKSPLPSPPVQPLNETELSILRETSYINDNVFLPWSNQLDLNSFHKGPSLYYDPNGFLSLSDLQLQQFDGWKRPSQYFHPVAPKMIGLVSSDHIIQDIVTDCSFVASLCICANYERKFRKRLITSIIYPQDSSGTPIYNPLGQYVIRLHFNGIFRKVVIDDYLPISKQNEPICTFSKFRGELWPSIIEKAYMKLMGGYAFPGSNSSIDLHALTGWIPELILFKVDSFDKETQWLRLRDGHNYGDALITVATGPEEEDLLDHMGLVPAHAYAVLDLRELHGLRVLKIKNPWSHCRWKGRLSHLDREYWTPELLEELEYDLLKAQEKDDGVFWILYEDLLEYFECFNVNWNPELFPHSQVIHTRWKTDKGPKKDTYNIGYNPQFSLRVNAVSEAETTPVWVLITKHRLKTEVNQQYFALHVYEDNSGQSANYRLASRVHYPDSPLIRGLYVNNDHILTRINVKSTQSKFILVLSQKELVQEFSFSIRAFSTIPVELNQIDLPKYEVKLNKRWDNESSGGNPTHLTFLKNPQFKLKISVPSTQLVITIQAPREYPVALYGFQGSKRITQLIPSSNCKNSYLFNSGDYRLGFCAVKQNYLPVGNYILMASAFDPKIRGDFIITIGSNNPIELTNLPGEGAGMMRYSVEGTWTPTSTSIKNKIRINGTTKLSAKLQVKTPSPSAYISMDILNSSNQSLLQGQQGIYSNSTQGIFIDEFVIRGNSKEMDITIISNLKLNLSTPLNFILTLYSDKKLTVL